MKSESDIGNVPSRRHRLSGRTPCLYRWCDTATEILVYFMVVFSPWAFGTTQPWSIWTMNGAGLTLGLLLLGKRLVQWKTGYVPARWGSDRYRWLTTAVVVLTALLPLWCLVSAVNARADFDTTTMQFEYRDRYLTWLPHSYDADSTWFAFWQVLGLWCAFWALRNWLLGKTRRERLHAHDGDATDDGHRVASFSPTERASVEMAPVLPARLQRLLWVLCVNGGLLALEGTFQRLSGTNKLLWLVEPRHGRTAEAQFGPYAYRGNAAQYLNLLWPVCLGFGLHVQHRSSLSGRNRFGSSPDLVLFLICALMIAAPLTMGTRGGTLVALGMLAASATVILVGIRRQLRVRVHIPLLLVVLVVVSSSMMGWDLISRRLLRPTDMFPLPQPLSFNRFTLNCQMQVPPTNASAGIQLMGLRSRAFDRGQEGGRLLLQIASDGALVAQFADRSATDLSVLRVTVPEFQVRFGGQDVKLQITRGERVEFHVNGNIVTNSMGPVLPATFLDGKTADYLWVVRQSPRSNIGWTPIDSVRVFAATLSPHEAESAKHIAAAHTARPDATRVLDLGPEQLQHAALWTGLKGDYNAMRVFSSGRSEIYATARRMVSNFIWLGSGPGTFGPLYGLYRADSADHWAWYAHNDFLETRITWGWIGSVLVLLALIGVAVVGGLGLEIGTASFVSSFIAVALIGCLAHAFVDFPFQTHSVAALFGVLACVKTVLASARRACDSPGAET